MAGRIFINYRRGDDPGFTQALFARLEAAFGPDNLFMDIDNIEPGLDFVRVLRDQLARCDILLAVIGRRWLEAVDESGRRRLDDENDFVRVEIEICLKLGKRIIPVLVNNATMPRAGQLPETLRPLAQRNAIRLTHERFRADTQGLITQLEKALEGVGTVGLAPIVGGTSQEPVGRRPETERQGILPSGRRVLVSLLVAIVVMVVVVGAYAYLRQFDRTVEKHSKFESALAERPSEQESQEEAEGSSSSTTVAGLPTCKANDDRIAVPSWTPEVDERGNLTSAPPQKDGQVVFVDLVADNEHVDCSAAKPDRLFAFSLPNDPKDPLGAGGLAVNLRGNVQFANGFCYFRGFFINSDVMGMHQGWTETYFGSVDKFEVIKSNRFCAQQ